MLSLDLFRKNLEQTLNRILVESYLRVLWSGAKVS